MRRDIPRRDFIRQGALAAAAAVVAPARAGLGRTAAARKAVVVGAGLAGLSAAYELRRAGHEVTVLEAQERPGGRVLTLRGFDDGLYADAGAARIPDNHELTLRYVKEFGLGLTPFYPEAGRFVSAKRGGRKEVDWKKFREAVEDYVGVILGDARSWHRIEGGNDLLPRAFAERLAGRVVYGAPVSRVEQDAGGARVTYGRGASAPETLAADYVVCAVPFAVLRRVEFSPRLSEKKSKTRDTMIYEMASRAFLQTAGRYWERGRANGYAVLDTPAEIWPTSPARAGSSRALLQAYVRHFTSVEWQKKAEAERVASALALAEQALPGARAAFERGVVKCWGEDEWAGYAWTHPSPTELAAVSAPEGRIHFAGEHASNYPSWMNGALESGVAAAKAVDEAAHREAAA